MTQRNKRRFYWLPTAIIAAVTLITDLVVNMVAPTIGDTLEPWAWVVWVVFGLMVAATFVIAIVSSRKNGSSASEPGETIPATSGERSVTINGDVHAPVNIGDGNISANTVNVVASNSSKQDDKLREKALLTNYLRRVQLEANALPHAIIDPRAMENMQRRSMNLLPLYIMLDTTTQKIQIEKALIHSYRQDNHLFTKLSPPSKPFQKNVA